MTTKSTLILFSRIQFYPSTLKKYCQPYKEKLFCIIIKKELGRILQIPVNLHTVSAHNWTCFEIYSSNYAVRSGIAISFTGIGAQFYRNMQNFLFLIPMIIIIYLLNSFYTFCRYSFNKCRISFGIKSRFSSPILCKINLFSSLVQRKSFFIYGK